MKGILLHVSILLMLISLSFSATLTVGKTSQYTTIASVAAAANDGDIVQIEAGDYKGDVAVWLQKSLTIIGQGLVRLYASGQSAEGKAIWVIRNGNFTISNIQFWNCQQKTRNGAGIRFENGTLTVQNSSFFYNDNGIMTRGWSNMELNIQNSEFGWNGAGDGNSHNLYIGQIGKFTVTNSYIHDANGGSLIKSRANENNILYNRITDETGTASRELSFPYAGLTTIMGNLIEQSATTKDGLIISYAHEFFKWSNNNLYVVFNTIVNNLSTGGTFLRVPIGASRVDFYNNLLVGTGSVVWKGPGKNFNFNADKARDFVNASVWDYHLNRNSLSNGKAITVLAPITAPTQEYLHPVSSSKVSYTKNPGAFQN